MPSLWSLMSKPQYGCYDPVTKWQFDQVTEFIRRHPPKLVDITDFAVQEHTPHTRSLDDMTPCHASMWFEWRPPEQTYRAAAHVARLSIAEGKSIWGIEPAHPEAKFLLVMSFWKEDQARPNLVAIDFSYIDALGTPLFDDVRMIAREGTVKAIASLVGSIGEIITTMNTRGTEIRPPLDHQPVAMKKPDRAPQSVWHTIHLPRFVQRDPLPPGVDITPEMIERREHWVRAHRADYRRGNGLFGRVKALIWVPEHKRGNPELGTVQQSFKVSPPEEEDE